MNRRQGKFQEEVAFKDKQATFQGAVIASLLETLLGADSRTTWRLVYKLKQIVSSGWGKLIASNMKIAWVAVSAVVH